MTDSLWLDSSIIRLGAPKLRALTELAQHKGVKVVVHAHVHLEICRYIRESRRAQGKDFSQSTIQTLLDQLGIEVAAVVLDRTIAESFAEILAQRYPDSKQWKQAKLSAVRARLPEQATVRAVDVPMSTDWLIALEVERQNVHIAVGDQGEEWATLRGMTPPRALSYDDTMQWLDQRPAPSMKPFPNVPGS